jgi:hypothetical protein
MEVEITIDRRKKLPEGAVHALEKEPLRRLDQNCTGSANDQTAVVKVLVKPPQRLFL